MAIVLGIATLCIVISTYRWPLLWDAQVFHYGNFLIEHGFAPYRDIIDMNMPGAYLIDGWAIKVFGAGDLAWRIFDFTLLGTLSLAMVAIARPYDWLAGLFAGVMFALIHVSEGPQNSGQRDEIMTVLIIAGCALLFESRRRRSPWMMIPFGLSFGMASSVKPTVAPLAVLLLVMALWGPRRKGEAVASYIWSSILGGAVAVAVVAGFLMHHGSAGALLATTRRLTAYYAGIDRLSFHLLLRFSVPLAVLLLLPFAIAVACVDRYWKNWEHLAILVGAAFGTFSYFVQGKGYPYHRYIFAAFALLWIAIQLTLAMRQAEAWVRVVTIAGLSVGVLVLVPAYTQTTLQMHPVNLFTPALEDDLSRMGADHLQRKVQCLDLIDGCLNALYHLHIVQNTGSMGDLLLFTPDKGPVVDYYRDEFWNSLMKNPPSVIVLSNEWFNRVPTFAKLDEWPQFSGYLAGNYKLVISRQFDEEAHHAYRIYVRHGMSFPALDQGRIGSLKNSH
jgi:hypothetical protein